MVNVHRKVRPEDSGMISVFKVAAHRKRPITGRSTSDQDAMSEDAGEERLTQTTPERNPLVTQV